MKKFSFLLMALFLGISSSYAATREEADSKFKARGPEGAALENSAQAAAMYADLYKEATSGSDVLEQASLLIEQSKALYYFGDHSQNNDVKKNEHDLGMKVAEQAAQLLHKPGLPTEPKEEDYRTAIASAWYWHCANMGKWGLANGILNSLRQWPDLRKKTEYIYALGEEDVESYGAHRILARAYYSLPFPLGDNSKALELMQEANEQTLDSTGEISSHSTNVIYYADVLIAKNKKDLAKKILQKLIERSSNLEEYNEDRIPESKEDIEIAKRTLERL